MLLIKRLIEFFRGRNNMKTKIIPTEKHHSSIYSMQMKSLMKQRSIDCREFVKKLDGYTYYIITKNYYGLVIAGADETYKRIGSFIKFNTNGFKKLLTRKQRSIRIKSVPRMDAEHVLFIMRNTPVKHKNTENTNELVKATVE